jgi:MFS transporter, PAT family, beta-lactamase induction signal transducer AmpG
MTSKIYIEKQPTFSGNSTIMYCSFALLYVAQGIPEGIILGSIPAWLAMNGKEPSQIGYYVSLILIPFTWKIVFAPIVERFTFLPMGRRRFWIILGQIGLTLSFIGFSLITNPLNNIMWLVILGFCLCTFTVFQDIATDSLVIDTVPANKYARVNGVMWGAKIISSATSLAIGTWLINEHGFFVANIFFATIVGIITLITILIRENNGEKLLPWTSGNSTLKSASTESNNWTTILKAIYKVFKLPNSLILVLISFITLLSISYIRTLLPIFTIQELKWSNSSYSQIYAVISLSSGIIGMFFGGYLFDKFGKIKILRICLTILIILTLIMVFSKDYWDTRSFIVTFIAISNLTTSLIIIGISALAMQHSWKKISALQFSLFAAINNLGASAGSALIGSVKGNLSWQYSILCFPVLVTIVLFLTIFLNTKKHLEQLDALDK